MTAAYDKYNYPAYWQERTYEHESEVIALKALLEKIPEISRMADVGCGFGRHTPHYAFRAKKIDLVDPSLKLLKMAQQKLKEFKNINYLHASLEKFVKKTRAGSYDFVVLIRVLHHLEKVEQALIGLKKVIKEGGYLLLEFPNKVHGKALIYNFLKGNLTFPLEIFPQDKRSLQAKKTKTIPFFNYHPATIQKILEDNNFEIQEILSVSNVRSQFLKKNLPLNTLLMLERLLQKPLARLFFGPSIFLLAKKVST